MIHSTKIKRSILFVSVTVRKWMGVNNEDYVGSLSQGTSVTGEVVFTRNAKKDIWMNLTTGQYEGGWIALSYNGKVFVDVLPVDPGVPVPGTGIRAYIYRNHEKQDMSWDHNYKAGLPDTRNIVGANVKNNGRILYTRRLQNFLYFELQRRVPEMNIDEFNKQFKYWTNDKLAFFNKAGSDSRRVWPLNLRLKSKDMEGNQLVFGGWTLELLSDRPSMVFDRLRFPLACINAQDENIESYNSFDHPELWVRPSITFGHTIVRQEPFDRFKARGRMPIMLNGTNIAWIEADKVRILAKDEPAPPQFTKDWGS